MKKAIMSVFLAVIMAVSLVGCSSNGGVVITPNDGEPPLIEVEKKINDGRARLYISSEKLVYFQEDKTSEIYLAIERDGKVYYVEHHEGVDYSTSSMQLIGEVKDLEEDFLKEWNLHKDQNGVVWYTPDDGSNDWLIWQC